VSSVLISLIAFVCSFGGVIIGLSLRKILPDHHLSSDSRDAVKMGTGLIATLTALVLGLLVSSAKQSFDSMNTAITQGGAKIITLDRLLANYGPEAKDTREQLRSLVTKVVRKVWPEEGASEAGLKTFEKSPAGMEALLVTLHNMSPQTDLQKAILVQALQLSNEMMLLRWQVIEERQTGMPTAFIVVLLFWLAILFACIGLYSPPNKTVIVVMFVCAMSIAGAIFLIREMNDPLMGIMKVSSGPFIKALEIMGK
jgi:hypothetical protein